MFLVATTLAMVGCGGGDEPDGGGALAGTYFGDVALEHHDQLSSIFATAELVVGPGGDLAGSSLTTTAPSATVGEKGAISGSIAQTGAATAEANITITLPTLGTFTGKGAITYDAAGRSLAALLPARDGTGAVIGSLLFSLKKE
jgi:hypothetical protein